MRIITLCGSTKFKEDFERMNKELTLCGYIVISVGCYGHSDPDPRIMENKDMLDRMHKRKIDIADMIMVIDKNGYIGSSTRSEIAYALETGKEVRYASDMKKFSSTW